MLIEALSFLHVLHGVPLWLDDLHAFSKYLHAFSKQYPCSHDGQVEFWFFSFFGKFSQTPLWIGLMF